MPVYRIGTCGICGKHNTETSILIGYMDGKFYIEWACINCRVALSQIREERKNHGESESQERTPGK